MAGWHSKPHAAASSGNDTMVWMPSDDCHKEAVDTNSISCIPYLTSEQQQKLSKIGGPDVADIEDVHRLA
eukprot:SAG25_NODE_9838_length_356_cov_0.599222_1_plen_69_part_01